ncbi:DNA primase [Aquicoccus sp. SCR17]|nr:DNA primase [Carideicomes alvinocaridis]
MSLPPGFLDELRSRTSLSQVVGRKVMWDNRKSNQAKGDMWAPCPFHQEKSASFHVDDRKGFYYCFGCHAKGDAISFVKDSENVEFMEAVEILAREAGMTMPQRDPKAREKADRASQLAEVMEKAVKHYRMQLRTAAAGAARDYLDRRGMAEETRERFEIGYAPDARQGVFQALTGQGVAPELLVEAGLCAKPDDGGAPYDRFRGRIIFPIRDARGRCIAFGGRAMDPNARAKYLNSPETMLFDKGRNLYNHGPAREAAGKGAPLIVAEGYMDVIALVAAGFGASVAPLGTAVTENQLQLLWRISEEPVIALDGDTAGLRAAYRVVDLALPLMEAGKSLRFALMPEGKDPDDLIREGGAEAMSKLVDGAIPMVTLLWQRETEGKVFDSPERRAALDKALREKIRLIRDPSLRSHYGEEVNRLRRDLFNPRRGWSDDRGQGGYGSGFGGGQGGQWQRGGRDRFRAATLRPLATTRASLLASADEAAQEHMREAVILASLIVTPEVVLQFEASLEGLECRDPDHRALRDLLLEMPEAESAGLKQIIEDRIGPAALEKLFAASHVAITPCVRKPGDAELAAMTVAEELAKLEAQRGLSAEIAEAEEDIQGLADEAVTWRLGQAAEASNRAARSQQEDRAEYDTGPNGAPINRAERSAFDALLNQISFSKRRS